MFKAVRFFLIRMLAGRQKVALNLVIDGSLVGHPGTIWSMGNSVVDDP